MNHQTQSSKLSSKNAAIVGACLLSETYPPIGFCNEFLLGTKYETLLPMCWLKFIEYMMLAATEAVIPSLRVRNLEV